MPEVPLPDDFEWTRFPWGPAIRCRALAGVADHCFTTRAPVLGTGPLTPGDGWHRVALAMGISAASIVRLRQVHGTRVVQSRAAPGVSARGARLERGRHRGQRPSRRGRLREGGRLRADPAGGHAQRECRRRPRRLARHGGRRGAGSGRGARRTLRLGARGPGCGHRAEHRPVLLPRRSGRARGVRGGRPAAGVARRLVQPDADGHSLARRARERTRRRLAAGPPCFSTPGPPMPISCATRAFPPRRSTSRASARPAIARPSTRIV